MSHTRIAAVTGSNKGIGFAIVRNLALQYPSSSLNNGPLLIYLTARDQSRGEEAIKQIQNDEKLRTAKALRQDGGLTDIKYHQLDISDNASIEAFEKFIKTEHADGIDILVNNAGVALDGFGPEIVRDTLKCNYYGTMHMNNTLLPYMRKNGRVVNVSSLASKLNKYSPELTEAFRTAKEQSQITALAEQFQSVVDDGTWSAKGWPSSAYSVSKACLTGATKVLGKQALQRDGGLLINSCCPGYVKTDMTKGGGRKTPDQGAQTPVKLALGDIQGVSGEFWEHEEISQW